MITDDLDYVLINELQIKEKTKELAKTLNKKFKHLNPLMVCVLKGSIPFFTELIKNMDIELEVDCISISDYGVKKLNGDIEIMKDIEKEIEGRHVVIVEDMVDTGKTINFLNALYQKKKVGSVTVCTLLDKPSLRSCDVKVDYSLFEIDDLFVVGFGLDYAEHYRNLPYVAVLKEEFRGKKN